MELGCVLVRAEARYARPGRSAIAAHVALCGHTWDALFFLYPFFCLSRRIHGKNLARTAYRQWILRILKSYADLILNGVVITWPALSQSAISYTYHLPTLVSCRTPPNHEWPRLRLPLLPREHPSRWPSPSLSTLSG